MKIKNWIRLSTGSAISFALSAAISAHAFSDPRSPQVDKIFADLQKPGSPGCALNVLRDGQSIYSKGYGLASVELDVPITPETVFDIGSTSKQFTASSILLLEQQGKLSVNDDIRKYIPELPDYSKDGGSKITILNLLNHTSGLRDYLLLLDLAGVNTDSVTTDDDALALIVRQKHLNFAPGSQFLYSNTGFFLLSVIVKRVSGMTLEDFASKKIFQPLGMTHTTYRDDHTMLIPHRALAYDPKDKGGYKLDVSYFEQLGDGAVHTSVDDLAKWDENFYSGQVGGKSFLAELQQPGKLNNGKTLDYAKGLFIQTYRGLPVVRHGGAWGGYRAELLRFPQQHFSVACLCNLSNANPEKRANEVADVVLGSLLKPAEHADNAPSQAAPEVSLSSSELQRFTGTYRDPETRNIARIAENKGKLELEIYGQKFGLRALSPTQFLPLGLPLDAELNFEPGANHAITGMKVTGDEEIAASYDKVTEFRPTGEELKAYTGDFLSDELGVIYRMRLVDGKLTLTGATDTLGIPRTGIEPVALRPTINDEFELTGTGVTVDFARNGKKAITGFSLDAGRTRGIEFVRNRLR